MDKPTPKQMKEWTEDIKRKMEERKKDIANGKIITKENEHTGISK